MKSRVLLLNLLFFQALAAQAVTTTATNSGNWNVAGNWDNGAPLAGYDAVIPAGRIITNTSSTADLASLEVGGTLVFKGWDSIVTAAVITVSGTITHLPNTDTNGVIGDYESWTPDNRIYIVCSNLTVATDGSINADGVGYPGGPRSATNAYGPGGGTNWGVGGGYGGWGGRTVEQNTYGSFTNPTDPGSGGGGSMCGCTDASGGAGGGAVRILADGTVTVNGIISCRGTTGGYSGGGGGSGGSIYIMCRTFGGANGKLIADGGRSQNYPYYGGTGGGGRIAVHYNPAAQQAQPTPSVIFSAATESGIDSLWRSRSYSRFFGDLGTLYFPDSQFLTNTTGTISHKGVWASPNFETWTADSITFSNAWLRIPVERFELSAANDVVFITDSIEPHKLELSNAVFSCADLVIHGSNVINSGGMVFPEHRIMFHHGAASGPIVNLSGEIRIETGQILFGDAATITVANDMLLTNGGFLTAGNMSTSGIGSSAGFDLNVGGNLVLAGANTNTPNLLYLYAGMTNASTTNYGALVNVAGELVIGSNCWVYPGSHYTNGGSVLFRLNNLTISGGGTNAGINAANKGFATGLTTYSAGYGPGRGTAQKGGGYGGLGGGGSQGVSGSIYGSSNAPVYPGSGGGTGYYVTGGQGGGLVRIEATGTISLNGLINADGQAGHGVPGGGSGGGSGGGVYLTCRKFSGTNAIVSANGGAGSSAPGGGGGRIAIWRVNGETNGVATVVDGGSGTITGAPGTIVWGLLPARGTFIMTW